MHTRIQLEARPNHRFVYSGRSLLVTNIHGGVTGTQTEGFYHENTRILSRDELRANGHTLEPVAASPVDGDGFLCYTLVPERAGVPHKAVVVQTRRFVDDGMWVEHQVENHNPHQTIRLDLAIHLAADFADMVEAERGEREQAAAVETTWDERRRELVFRYRHPELDRAVAIRVERAPGRVEFCDGALVFPLTLPPHQPVDLQLAVEPIVGGQRHPVARQAFGQAATNLDRLRQRLRDEMPHLTTTNPTVARAWQTAVADLATLPLGDEAGPAAPIAGLPLYQQVFGRDMLTIGWQALLATPDLVRDALLLNASMQGTKVDDWRDEEPGKMLHQARQGPVSALGLNPFTRYYGDYATPPDFLIMLGQYLLWTGDLATVRRLLPAARQAIDWLDRYGDLDGDGFIEYVCRSERGVKNQGWKDSTEAIVDERGHLVENPIATSELQGYWYAGLRQAAYAFLAAGDQGYALELRRKAKKLKQHFDTAFWMEREQFYALALGPKKEPVRSIASNAGHLLATGIVPRKKATAVVRRLMEPDLFSGWGVRTLSSEHVSYNPFSYHLGSVWPVDSGTFALGFGRYGFFADLHRLTEGLFAASDLFVANRLPESIGGFPRDSRHPHPGIYPQSNAPQGWSASAIVIMLQALLGLRPVAPLGLLLVDPTLPAWLPDLRLDGVRVGNARLDLAFQRSASGATDYRVTRREGSVRVVRQPPPDAPSTTLVKRARAGIGSLLPW